MSESIKGAAAPRLRGDGPQEGAEALATKAAEHGNTGALYWLAQTREQSERRESAEALVTKAAE
ncbi:hypothetical protein [Streptomyces sp. TLI_105]|uniref:hypothetical protein n=1 Tax=Streptomyces sp. TLI_105 TaxID=1881019 RepID=UPI00115FE3C1|nr:hypothetical protein [Streptomyces sp. TLI_105]